MTEEQFRVLLESQISQYEIDNEMKKWCLADMLSDLWKKIGEMQRATGQENNPRFRPVRSFARRYLGLSGDREYLKIKEWVAGSPIEGEDVKRVIAALARLRTGDWEWRFNAGTSGARTKKSVPIGKSKKRPRSLVPKAHASGFERMTIDVTISFLSTLVGLVVESGVKPSDVFDGDKMRIAGAMKKICDRFGIPADFPEDGMSKRVPVTEQDLKEMGLGAMLK